MIYKRCGRCGKRILSGTTCECYKKYKRSYKKPEGIKIEYHKDKWRRLRAAVISKYDGLDIFALYYLKRIEPADTVHHIEITSDRPDLFYRFDNLIPVGRHSHDIIHELYKKDKEGTQNLLRGYLKQYDEHGGI